MNPLIVKNMLMNRFSGLSPHLVLGLQKCINYLVIVLNIHNLYVNSKNPSLLVKRRRATCRHSNTAAQPSTQTTHPGPTPCLCLLHSISCMMLLGSAAWRLGPTTPWSGMSCSSWVTAPSLTSVLRCTRLSGATRVLPASLKASMTYTGRKTAPWRK